MTLILSALSLQFHLFNNEKNLTLTHCLFDFQVVANVSVSLLKLIFYTPYKEVIFKQLVFLDKEIFKYFDQPL